jgi:hypothetical protein
LHKLINEPINSDCFYCSYLIIMEQNCKTVEILVQAEPCSTALFKDAFINKSDYLCYAGVFLVAWLALFTCTLFVVHIYYLLHLVCW